MGEGRPVARATPPQLGCTCRPQGLENIIQRDFFPDVARLRAQREYLEAEESGDLEKMRQIAIKFGSALGRSGRDAAAPCKSHAGCVPPECRRASSERSPGRQCR